MHAAGDYRPEMLNDEPLLGVVNETNRILAKALDVGIADNIPSPAMLKKLREDVFVFSGFKTHAQLKEAASYLLTDDGKIKPFQDFRRDVWAVHTSYNSLYLEAEYIFATSSAEMASRWSDYEKDGDRYNLQYRTAGDDRVRDEHAAINLTTLPIDDPFWGLYMPPNGWRCRCGAVQVRKGKYDESNSDEAMTKGEKATTRINKKGENADAIFRFNPGKDKVIFPPHHPYKTVPESVKKVVKNLPAASVNSLFKIDIEVKTIEDLNKVFSRFAKVKKDYFAHGFKKIEIEKRANANGSTDRRGNIWLTKSRIDNTINALNNIKRGIKTTFEQEDSLSTLWHEITHNRNGKAAAITTIQRARMELANEFVSRNTLSSFMGDLGAELQNTSLINTRTSTGYNSWVRKYDSLIKFTGADKTKVLSDVQEHLFNKSYKDQTTGLVDAILNNSTKSFTKVDVKKAVEFCTGSMNENKYDEWLKTLKVKVKK